MSWVGATAKRPNEPPIARRGRLIELNYDAMEPGEEDSDDGGVLSFWRPGEPGGIADRAALFQEGADIHQHQTSRTIKTS